MPWKYCRKFEPPEYGTRTLQTTDDRQTDRQTTDERATANSERERELTFAKNQLYVELSPTVTSIALTYMLD